MDSRVTAMFDDMEAGRISHPDGSLDSEALNERIKALHPLLEDEESRVELIALHDALMRTSDRRLVEVGRDPGPLREEWRRTHLSFLLAESLTDGEVDEEKLARVNAREIAAGRLHPEEAVRIRRADPDPADAARAAAAEKGVPAVPARLRSGTITGEDYPSAALDRGEEGSVSVDFLVTEDGRVEDVRILTSSGSADLDKVTCSLIRRRFRYLPARDATGEPVAQIVSQSLTWRLEDAPWHAEPPEPVREELGDPPAAGAEQAPSELERAYRAILRWEDERTRPRLDALVEDFRARLRELEPGEGFRAAAEREVLEVARWFEQNEQAFVAEAVSYLDDDILQGLKELGLDGQFGSVIWNAVDEDRAKLTDRLHEAREAACAEAGAGDGSG